MNYTLVMLKNEVRVEFNMETGNSDFNTAVYEELFTRKQSIESDFGDQLVWYSLPGRKACRLKYRK